jgi:hypothetical protein
MIDRMRGGERVLTLVAENRVREQTLHRWKHQALVDAGLMEGVDSAQNAEFLAGKRRIKDLEDELQRVKDASNLSDRTVVDPREDRSSQNNL